MDLEGAAGDKVIDIFSTTSQNCLVCALEGKEARFYMKSVRGHGEEFNKIFLCTDRKYLWNASKFSFNARSCYEFVSSTYVKTYRIYERLLRRN